MRRIISGLAAAAVVTAALVLSGCDAGKAPHPSPAASQPKSPTPSTVDDNGISAKSAKQIVAASRTAFSSARSVRIRFSGQEAGKRIRMDIKLTRGKDAAGWIEQEGVRINIIVIGGSRVYLKSRKLWEQQGDPRVARFIGDRWVKAPQDQASEMNPFGNDLTIRGFTKEFFARVGKALFTSKSRTTVAGRPALRLEALDGTYVVAATGKPYPLRLVAEEAGDVQFSQYDQDFAIKAPPDALDLDKLGS